MPNEPLWLTVDQLVELNRLVVATTAEPFFLCDRALIELAQAKPIHR